MTIIAGGRSTTRGMATITTRALPKIPPRPALHVAATERRLSGPLSQIKSISRVAESVALREAEAEGAFDALLLNERGRVVETTARNVFLVSDGALLTPATYEGALPGITRSAVLEIAAGGKIRARETPVSLGPPRGAGEGVLLGRRGGGLGIGSGGRAPVHAAGPGSPKIQG